MAGDSVLMTAERVCSEYRKPLVARMDETDRRGAGWMAAQFKRLDEICQESRREEKDSAIRNNAEYRMETILRRMGEFAVDFVFEHEAGNTTEMAAFFACLGYAGGDAALTAEYVESLRLFGRGGQIEKAFQEAGELSDDTIPVMEAFRHMQQNFILREDGGQAHQIDRDFYEPADLKRLKKACGAYLETTVGKNDKETEAVKEAARQVERAEKFLKMINKEKVTFSDMMRQEEKRTERKQISRRLPERMELKKKDMIRER